MEKLGHGTLSFGPLHWPRQKMAKFSRLKRAAQETQCAPWTGARLKAFVYLMKTQAKKCSIDPRCSEGFAGFRLIKWRAIEWMMDDCFNIVVEFFLIASPF